MPFFRERSYWLSVALVTYASAAQLEPPIGHHPLSLVVLGVLPFLLAAAWRATRSPIGASDGVEESARAAARVAIAGAAVVIACLAGHGATQALSYAGAGLASVAGLVAVARVGTPGGLVTPPRSARRLEAAVIAAFGWSVAVAANAALAVSPQRAPELGLASAYAGSAASVLSLSLLLAFAAGSLRARSLELGVVERLRAVAWLGGAALAVGVAASALRLTEPESMLPVATTAIGVAAGLGAATQRPETVARVTRHFLWLGALAAPPALGAAFVAVASPRYAPAAVVGACVVCAFAGLVAPRLSRRSAPEHHVYIDAFEAATRAAMSPDPDPAVEEALLSLRAISSRHPSKEGGAAIGPALFQVAPPVVRTVDRAGFVHREKAVIPDALLELAASEPGLVLRTEALDAASVRHPEVRPSLEWLRDRGIGAAALMLERDEPVGILAIPSGDRRTPYGIEEVGALRALADRLAAVVAVSAKLGRSWEREQVAREAEATVKSTAGVREEALSRARDDLVGLLERLADNARIATYSPASRSTVERIERLAQAEHPIILLTAPGIDAVSYAAICHLESASKEGPFVIVDGASKKMADLMLWRDEAESPLVRAKGGTLVLLFPDLLPKLVQSYVGAAAGFDVKLVIVVAKTIDVLVAHGTLEDRFADRVGDALVALPELVSRSEDMRALALHYLGDIGTRFRAKAIGIEPGAIALLAEHDWPGNDAELIGTLTRAAARCDGQVVRKRDLLELVPPERPRRPVLAS